MQDAQLLPAGIAARLVTVSPARSAAGTDHFGSRLGPSSSGCGPIRNPVKRGRIRVAG